MGNNDRDSNDKKAYETYAAHNFFGVIKNIVGKEIKQGNTMTFISEVDLTEIEDIRSQWGGGKKPTYTAFIAKAAVLALKDYPYANRRIYRLPLLPFAKPRLQSFKGFDVGVACERDVPDIEVATFMDVLRGADRLSLSEITAWLHALATCDESNNKQWRDFFSLINRCPSWLSSFIVRLPVFFPNLWWKWRGGALAISSPAKYGVDTMVGAWAAPLGVSFGFAKERAVVKGGKVVACQTFALTLNWDRRVMAGAQAAKFFKRIVDILENPAKEMAPYLD